MLRLSCLISASCMNSSQSLFHVQDGHGTLSCMPHSNQFQEILLEWLRICLNLFFLWWNTTCKIWSVNIYFSCSRYESIAFTTLLLLHKQRNIKDLAVQVKSCLLILQKNTFLPFLLRHYALSVQTKISSSVLKSTCVTCWLINWTNMSSF